MLSWCQLIERCVYGQSVKEGSLPMKRTCLSVRLPFAYWKRAVLVLLPE